MREAPWLQELDLIVGLLATVVALCSLGAVAQGSLVCCLLFAANAAMAHQAWVDYARRVAPDGDDEPVVRSPAPVPVALRPGGARLHIRGASSVASVSPGVLHAAGLGRAGVLDVAQAAGFTRREEASAELRLLMDLCRHEGSYRGAEFAQFHAGERPLGPDEAVFLVVVGSAKHPSVVCFIGKRA